MNLQETQLDKIKTKFPFKEVFFLTVIYLTFIALGLPDTGFGVAWSDMRADFGVPLEAAGAVSMIVTACGALSGFSSGYLLNRFGTGKVTAFSCLATAIAILGYSISGSYWHLLILAIPLGFGAGAVDSGLNAYAAENLSAKHMNWLHCSWGIGATLSPLIITFGITTFSSWRYGYGIIGGLVLLLSIVILLNLSMWKSKSKPKEQVEEIVIEKPWIKGLAPVLSVSCYALYAIMESGLGLWLSSLLIESRGLDISLSGTIVGTYFGSIMVGRFLMGFIANKLGNRKLINLGITIAIIGASLFLIKGQPILYVPGVMLMGLGFAPLYPSMMHETSNRYGSNQAKKVIGNQVAFAYVSALVFVPLLGVIGTHTHLEVIPVIIISSIALLALVIRKLNKLT